MNRADFQRLSRLRLLEARSLFNAKLYSGAYYLSGYAVECGLKACIARTTPRYEFPDKERVLKSYSHRPGDLLRVANLTDDLAQAIEAKPGIEANWDMVTGWSEQSRYRLWSQAEAREMMDAVAKRKDGVLPWIAQHW